MNLSFTQSVWVWGGISQDEYPDAEKYVGVFCIAWWLNKYYCIVQYFRQSKGNYW